MEKFGPFKPDEETIESWLDAFEARLLCHNINACDRKRNWCQALVGEAGRSIIRRLPPRATWDEIKQKLSNVLGETNPKDQAFDTLLNYKSSSKGLGELATEVIAKAIKATEDTEVQNRLVLKAFIKAVPEAIGKELRRKHLRTVREALIEERFLQRVEEEENGGKGKVLTVEVDTVSKERSEKDIVEECLKQLEKRGLVGERRGRTQKGKLKCWCCGKEGHMLMQCPTVISNRAAQQGASQGKNSGNE